MNAPSALFSSPALDQGDICRAKTLAIEVEAELLGTLMLLGDSALDSLPSQITEDAFVVELHRATFVAIKRLAATGSPVTPVDVYDALQGAGVPLEFDALRRLTAMSTIASGSLAGMRSRCARLLEAARFRALCTIAKTIDTVIAEQPSAADAGAEVVRRIEEASHNAGQKEARKFADIIGEILAFHSAFDDMPLEEIEKQCVRTGLANIDYFLPLGLEAGDLVVLGARPSMGKTALAAAIAQATSAAGHATMIVSMEMSGSQVVHRMLASSLRIPLGRLRSLKWDGHPDLHAAALDLLTAIEEQPLWIEDQAPCSIDVLALRVRAWKRRLGLRVLIVDYLQLMPASSNADDRRSAQIEEISRGLKALAKDLGITVIALAQLNRGVENRPNKRPTMSDLRESGSIEQDADVVALLYRDDYYNEDSSAKGVVEVIFSKQRSGPVGTAYLDFLREEQYFRDSSYSPSYATPLPVSGTARTW
jgi:replicative DNA helicase